MAFCVPYRRLRRQRRIVEHNRREIAAIDRNGAGKDEARLVARRAADFEQRAGAVQVHPHAEIEVRFRLAADDRREMKDGRSLAVDGALEQLPVADVAGDLCDPRIVQAVSRDDVDERDPVNPLVAAEVAELQQPGCESLAEETGAAGNEYAHGR